MSNGSKPQGKVAEQFFGAWRYLGTIIDGKPRQGRGEPKGVIIYDPSGAMAVHIVSDRQQAFATDREPTPAEVFEAMEDCVAYFGTYAIDETAGIVTHHREASVRLGDRGDLVRRYRFEGDRLILMPLGKDQQVLWERIK